MKASTRLWTKKKKLKGHSKINEWIKRNMCAWITRHPQVFQLSISNDCPKVIFDDQTEPILFTNFLLQVSARELHNSLVSDTNDGGIKDSRYEDDNVTISDSTLRSLLPPLLKKCLHNTRSCVVVNVEFLLKVYIHHYYPGGIGIWKNSNIESKILKEEVLVKKHIT